MKNGRQLIAFNENGRVFFEDGLNVVEDQNEVDENLSEEEPLPSFEQNNSFKTLAKAEYIELLELTEVSNRFLLVKNVDVKSEDLDITCNEMEIFLEKDSNQSVQARGIGRISKIFAVGKVRMNQPGRSSFADKMEIDAKSGEAILWGNAKVKDEEYGVATGDKIVLESEREKPR